jgi:hypothetical protein
LRKTVFGPNSLSITPRFKGHIPIFLKSDLMLFTLSAP